jgi:hypothetical protein
VDRLKKGYQLVVKEYKAEDGKLIKKRTPQKIGKTF